MLSPAGSGQPTVAPADGTVPVTIVTGNYTGGFMLNNSGWLYGKKDPGSSTYYLAPGSCSFDVARVGVSAFYFQVDSTGNVTSVDNAIAAKAEKGALKLSEPVDVLIDPGVFGGDKGTADLPVYTHEHFQTWISQPRTFKLVPGLVYGLDNGEYLESTGFLFYVAADGAVHVGSPAASGGVVADERYGSKPKGVLRLNGALIEVQPPPDAPAFMVGSNTYSGNTTVPVLVGAITMLRSQSSDPGVQLVPAYGGDKFANESINGRTYRWRLPWGWKKPNQ